MKRAPQKRRPAEPVPAPNQDALDFSLEETVIPINIKDKAGETKQYVLREANGGAAVAWRNAVARQIKLGPNGKPQSMGEIANVEPLLVSLCMTLNGTRVPEQTVRSWPARVQKALFEKAKDISDLEEDDPTSLVELQKERDELEERIRKLEEEDTLAKNGQGDTTVG